MNTSSLMNSRTARAAAFAAMLLGLNVGAIAATTLADQPVFATSEVPGNLALALSVEYPTAVRTAHVNAYASATTYLGYFDPNKCYDYKVAADTAASYFSPAAKATTHTCSGKWSGNFLNWATTQTIDPFRWAMTGGHRVVDTTTETILQKAYHSGQGLFDDRNISGATLVSGATPFNYGSLRIGINGRGFQMVFRGDDNNLAGNTLDYDPSKPMETNRPYAATVRVKVCDTGTVHGGPEANCTQYGTNWKPEGLIQQYSGKMRFSAFGYLNQSGNDRDGGVMRARQKFVGPTEPKPGQPSVTNAVREWDAATGIFVQNPDATDAKTASDYFGVPLSNSGVMNYLNKFGQLVPGDYKSNDPVGELYYATLRYYRNLGNVSSWYAMGNANTSTKTTRLDGFPVIKDWDDPIQHSCQRNFVLGIGDIYTHADKNVPGNTRTADEPTMPTEVSADTSVNAVTATNKVGELQGMGSTLGTDGTQAGCCSNNSNMMAGLAYDANTKDIRPDVESVKKTIGKQTVQTYWVDVLERAFQANNQFYLTAKFGGLKLPDSEDPYAFKGTIRKEWWSTSGEKVGSQDRPDNYFTAGQPDTMVAGLAKAFASIANSIKAFTTSFSLSTVQVAATGSASYASQYDSKDWTGVVTGNTLTFATNGTASSTPVWSTSTKLEAQAKDSGWDTARRIVTWSGSAGTPFRSGNLSSAQLALVKPQSYATGRTAADYVNYLRGDRTYERTETDSSKDYRARTVLLGDIVDSKVTPVAAPNLPLLDAVNPGYGAFKTTWAARPTMVYVGANDGMLHAFNGSLTTAAGGTEQFAYVPSALYAKDGSTDGLLAQLGNPDYTHKYFVDATPLNFDIDLNYAGKTFTTTSSATSDWRTLLIGGLGKGGKSFYAIDVTDPASMTTEAVVAGKVKWEFTDTTMGYSFGAPVAVKTKKYGWVVIFTSGYNSSSTSGAIYIVNPRNGMLLEKISTPTASDGLTQASAYITDFSDGTADAVYAGDLNGQVWRFDLTQAKGSSANYPEPVKIATLTDANGLAQPVTTQPLIEIQPITKRRFVLVGTGKLLNSSDIQSPAMQSFYALVDGTSVAFNTTGTAFPIARAGLQEVLDVTKGIALTANSSGWFFDLEIDKTANVGWRVVNALTSYSGLVAFSSLQTTGDACSPAGTSRVYAIDFGTGKTALVSTAAYVANGAAITDLRFISVDGKTQLMGGDVGGKTPLFPFNPPAGLGLRLMNWREVPTVD